MKRLFFIVILAGMFCSCSRHVIYRQPVEQETIQFAYKVMKVYYPSDLLCVADSIYDLDWDIFTDLVVDTVDIRPSILSYRENKGNVRERPKYSKILSKLFGHCVCIDSGYVAEFSAPYKGMIRCDVVPKNGIQSPDGDRHVSAFLFEYDEYGKVSSVTKTEYIRNSRID